MKRIQILLLVTFVFAVGLMPGCGRSDTELRATALTRLNAGDNEAALAILERLAIRNPERADDQCHFGIALSRMGQHDRAIKSLSMAVALNDEDAAPLEFLGALFIEREQWDEARSALASARLRAPMSPRISTAMALIEYKAGSAETAQALLADALDLDPDYAPALYNMGILLRDEYQDTDKAAEYLRMFVQVADDEKHIAIAEKFLVALPPDSMAPDAPLVAARFVSPAEPLVRLAEEAIEGQELDKALIALKHAMREDPNYASAFWYLAVLYEKHFVHADRAAEAYQKFVERFPDDPRIEQIPPKFLEREPEVPPEGSARTAFLAGVKCHTSGDLDGAIAHYGQALAVDDQFAEAFYNLGLAHKGKGDIEKARDAFVCALNIDPEMIKGVFMLAVTYREQRDIENAIKQAKKVVRIDPDYAKAHFLLGLLYNDAMRYDEAKDHFERCVQLGPSETFASKAKEWLARML